MSRKRIPSNKFGWCLDGLHDACRAEATAATATAPTPTPTLKTATSIATIRPFAVAAKMNAR